MVGTLSAYATLHKSWQVLSLSVLSGNYFHGFSSFTHIMCVMIMKQPYASCSRKRAVFLVWTLNLAALMLIKPGLKLRGSAVLADQCIHAVYLYAWSFACCFFLVVLIFFIFPSFNHKRWTRMNVWLCFLLKTLLPWGIMESIANPAFTDAMFLH